MCDGGSKDNTVQKVKDFSQRVNVPVKVTHSQPGWFFQSLNRVINIHVWIQKFFPKVGGGLGESEAYCIFVIILLCK